MIPNVSDRNRMPRLGKIRLGEKRTAKSGKEYPAALDYFNFKDVPEVLEVYGEGCAELRPIILPHDDENIWFPTARKAYRQTGLFCACHDGETADRTFVEKDAQGLAFVKQHGLDLKEGDRFNMPCPGEECGYFENKFCKNIGRLLFFLPNVPGFGVYEITTSSYNSIVNVLSSARLIASMTGGRIAGLPLALRLAPMTVQPDGKSKTVHVLELHWPESLAELAKKGRLLQQGRGAIALLGAPPAEEEPPDDLYAHGGAALDAELSKDSPSQIVPPAGSKLDELAGQMAQGDDGEPAGEDDGLPFRSEDEHKERVRQATASSPKVSKPKKAAAGSRFPSNF